MSERKIKITAGSVAAAAVLNDSGTASKIWDALPITGVANRWGEEIYFSIPVSDGSAPEAREVVSMGELAYWPPGKAFCIFFGRTPVSRGSEIRAASAVNPLGSVSGDAKVFLKVRDGEAVMIEKAE